MARTDEDEQGGAADGNHDRSGETKEKAVVRAVVNNVVRLELGRHELERGCRRVVEAEVFVSEKKGEEAGD